MKITKKDNGSQRVRFIPNANLPNFAWRKKMTSTAEIKDWIREIQGGKAISDSSILVQKQGEAHTRITLLNACCSPHFTIEKKPGQIKKTDLEAKRSLINHQH